MPKLTDKHFPTLQKRCQAHRDHRVDESPLTQTNQPAATLKQVDVADLAAASPGAHKPACCLLAGTIRRYATVGQRPRRFPANDASYKLEVLGMSGAADFAVSAAGGDAVASTARIRCVAANAWGLCMPHKATGPV